MRSCVRLQRRSLERLERRNLLAGLVDLDLDGDLDVVTDDGWHENHDSFGNFIIHEYSSLIDAAAGDIDGDGDLDIAGRQGWLENTDGLGEFGSLRNFPAPDGASMREMKLQDIGGDGDLDVVMYGRERVLHFDNVNGRGEFVLLDEFSIPGVYDVGDVNDDGRVDVVVMTGRETWVYQNLGAGEFEPILWHEDEDPNDFPGHGHEIGQTISAEFIDANHDGWLDLVRVEAADGFYSLVAHYNDQTGDAGEERWIKSCFGGCTYLFDDLDDDGAADFIVTEIETTVAFYRNDGEGDFELTPPRFLTGASILGAGDINGDRVMDLALESIDWIDGATGQQHVPGTKIDLPVPRRFTFVSQPLGKSDGPVIASTMADLDGDQVAELIVANTSIDVWKAGDHPRTIFGSRRRIDRVEAVDMDGDRDNDIVFSDFQSLAWLENLGDEQFSSPRIIDSRGRGGLRYWSLGDINQDGHVDLVTASRGAGVFGGSSVRLCLNRDGFFQKVDLSMHATTVRALIVADVDGDRDLDVYAETGRWQDVDNRHDRVHESIWFENRDDRMLDAVILDDTGVPANTLLSGDLNGDSRADLVITSYAGVAWHDAFAGRGIRITDAETSPSITDVDEDGDLDLIGHDGNRVVWYENQDGEGTFSGGQMIGAQLVSSVHFGDYTGNGKKDLITVHHNGPISLFVKRVTGDSNGDGVFDSSDLLQVFRHAEYEDAVHRNSTFETGDWNGDGEFNSSDLVYAMQAGTYVPMAESRQRFNT